MKCDYGERAAARAISLRVLHKGDLSLAISHLPRSNVRKKEAGAGTSRGRFGLEGQDQVGA